MSRAGSGRNLGISFGASKAFIKEKSTLGTSCELVGHIYDQTFVQKCDTKPRNVSKLMVLKEVAVREKNKFLTNKLQLVVFAELSRTAATLVLVTRMRSSSPLSLVAQNFPSPSPLVIMATADSVTMAKIEGKEGWGLAGDVVIDKLLFTQCVEMCKKTSYSN